MEFTSVHSMIDEVNDAVESFVRENFERVSADKLGLDIRAGYRLYVNEDCIAASGGDTRTLNYYGGFEYVDSEYVQTVGDYTFYMADDERVREHIATYFDRAEEEMTEEEAE
jgi:hypothetical protein